MRALVTGGRGFAGSWLVRLLTERGHQVEGLDADVTDADSVAAAIRAARPEVVFHLAAVSDPGEAGSDPERALDVNAGGTRNVLTASCSIEPAPSVLVTSSSAVYAPANQPLSEASSVNPGSGYVDSKLAAEAVCAEFAGDLRIVVVRAFNHTGPGQPPIRVIPALAGKIMAAARDGAPIRTGRLDVRRDLMDVRDTVAAYVALMESDAEGLFNVCSGVASKLQDLADELAQLVGLESPQFELDHDLVRPDEPALIVGDNTKLREATGWEPRVPMIRTLADVLGSVDS